VTYALSAALQAAVYQRLAGNDVLAGMIGDRIYDAPLEARPGETPPDHVTLGEEAVRPDDTKTSTGAVHDFSVTVHSARDGFDAAKRIAAAVCEALVDAPLALAEGHLVALRFLRARADRGRAPEKRRISLRFRAVLEADG
jgi:Protein of unknown function (DUF3168)